MLTAPLVFIIFRRPDLTRRVFEAIAEAKPQILLVVADGPRADRPDDADACAATREVVKHVDWDCQVLRNYSDANLGCGLRPASGISWAFEHVDEAIILEDDCLPHASFFPFAQELLERYRADERVMFVSGSSYRRTPVETPYSYYFSQWGGCWGWATWRRAWHAHDMSVRAWPGIRETPLLTEVLQHPAAVQLWSSFYDQAYQAAGQVSYWDYQWALAVWSNSGLAVVPRANLITNIGCGPQATHTLNERDPLGNLPVQQMPFPLTHPPRVLRDLEADRDFVRTVIHPRSIPKPANPNRRPWLRRLASMSPDFLKHAHRALMKTYAKRITDA